jgi:hypothetical protein
MAKNPVVVDEKLTYYVYDKGVRWIMRGIIVFS